MRPRNSPHMISVTLAYVANISIMTTLGTSSRPVSSHSAHKSGLTTIRCLFAASLTKIGKWKNCSTKGRTSWVRPSIWGLSSSTRELYAQSSHSYTPNLPASWFICRGDKQYLSWCILTLLRAPRTFRLRTRTRRRPWWSSASRWYPWMTKPFYSRKVSFRAMALTSKRTSQIHSCHKFISISQA